MASGGDDISIKKILVPVDGSPVSKKAAQYAVHIAKKEGASLVLLNVLPDVKQGGAIGLQAKYGNMRIVQGFQRARMQSAQQWMSEMADMAGRHDVRASMEILPDDGTHEVGVITEYAGKNGVDLIVMGSKGQSKFKKLLLGSVASEVISYSPCPVLVVR